MLGRVDICALLCYVGEVRERVDQAEQLRMGRMETTPGPDNINEIIIEDLMNTDVWYKKKSKVLHVSVVAQRST